MTHHPSTPIIITDGYCMYSRHTGIFHGHYKEIRGKSASLADAASHLVTHLGRAPDCVNGCGFGRRDALESALGDVRAIPSVRPEHRLRCRNAVAGFESVKEHYG
jgi:hypothetical protein